MNLASGLELAGLEAAPAETGLVMVRIEWHSTERTSTGFHPVLT